PDARGVAFRRPGVRAGGVLLARADAPGRFPSRAMLRQQHRAHATAPRAGRRFVTEYRVARNSPHVPGRELARQSSCETVVRTPGLETLADRLRLVRYRGAGSTRAGGE